MKKSFLTTLKESQKLDSCFWARDSLTSLELSGLQRVGSGWEVGLDVLSSDPMSLWGVRETLRGLSKTTVEDTAL